VPPQNAFHRPDGAERGNHGFIRESIGQLIHRPFFIDDLQPAADKNGVNFTRQCAKSTPKKRRLLLTSNGTSS
jgi:hypothetical protein